MRLFTGIDLPEPIKQHLDVLVSRLRHSAHIKWSPVYNLHITTKFIGEWEPGRLPELTSKLRTISLPAVSIDIRGVGWFPNEKSPRVFFAGVHSEALAALARATDSALSELGIALETRVYSPHLTLARIKDPVPLEPMRKAVADMSDADFGSFTASHFHLFHSERGASGSVYTKLEEYPLSSA